MLRRDDASDDGGLRGDADLVGRPPVRQGTSRARRGYVLGILTAVLAFNYLDRNIFNVLIQPIKAELHLSDATLGFMSSTGTGLFLALLTIPFARLADKSGRVWVVSAGLLFWSAMTIATGLAATPLMLLAARTLVGVGEASSIGPAQALLADYFSQERRSGAMSIYMSATFIGVLLAFVLGAEINAHLGWRMAFIGVGLPGIVVAALAALTVKDRPAGAIDRPVEARGVPVMAALKFLFSQRSFVLILFGSCLALMANFALVTWIAPLLQRVHHFSNARAGLTIGPISGFGGIAGSLIGAALVGRLSRRDMRWTLRAPALAALLYAIAILTLCFAQDLRVVLTALGATAVCAGFLIGPVLAANLTVAPPGMRGIAAASNYMLSSIFGLGLSPPLIGLLSDLLSGRFGTQAVRYALLAAPVSLCGAAVLLSLGARHLVSDMQRAALKLSTACRGTTTS